MDTPSIHMEKTNISKKSRNNAILVNDALKKKEYFGFVGLFSRATVVVDFAHFWSVKSVE